VKAPPLAVVAAAIVSDTTSLAVLGLTGRQFRAFLREQAVPHTKIGRRTVARVDRVLDAIDRLSGAEPARAPWSEDDVIARAARKTGAR
jgi:hypothetical protein